MKKTSCLRRHLPYLVTVFVAIAITSCSENESSRSTQNSLSGPGVGPKNGKQFVVGYVPLDNPRDEYWKAYDDGIKAAVRRAVSCSTSVRRWIRSSRTIASCSSSRWMWT